MLTQCLSCLADSGVPDAISHSEVRIEDLTDQELHNIYSHSHDTKTWVIKHRPDWVRKYIPELAYLC